MMNRYVLILLLIAGCKVSPVAKYGCLDSQACNYDPSATLESNLPCLYAIDCEGVCGGELINVTDNSGNDCGCGLEENLLDSDNCCASSVCDDRPCTADECGVCGGDGSICLCDYDENCYKTIQIGTQLWMAENLKVRHYINGDSINTAYTNDEWADLSSAAYSVYDDTSGNGKIYGKLYNWYSIDDERGICPEGWHVPTDDEYMILIEYLGGDNIAGGKMKSTGTIEIGDGLWYLPNEGSTNESVFSALPGGVRHGNNGYYLSLGYVGYFWSATEHDDQHAWQWKMSFETLLADRIGGSKKRGLSVRCVQDSL